MTLYLYAIVDVPPRAALGVGIAKRRLAAVRAGQAWVIAERAGAPDPSPVNLRAHDRVVRRIARACPAVLPLRFGSVAADRTAVVEMLAPFARSLDGAFDRVRGCVQFTLRVSGRARPRRRVRTGGPGTRWLAERLAAQQVPEIDPITTATRPWTREARAARHPAASSTSAPSAILASVYHLVPRKDVRRWRAALQQGSEALDDVSVQATGPWPPYAFAELP